MLQHAGSRTGDRAVESLKSGHFPLSRALYPVLDGRTATDTVQGFIDFLLEPEGQSFVRRAGYLTA